MTMSFYGKLVFARIALVSLFISQNVLSALPPPPPTQMLLALCTVRSPPPSPPDMHYTPPPPPHAVLEAWYTVVYVKFTLECTTVELKDVRRKRRNVR